MEYKIIIVDDEIAARENLSIMLTHLLPNVQIQEAENIWDAKKIIEEWHPQILFLDIKMPDHDGFELLEIIDTNKIIVVCVTAHLNYSIGAIRKKVFDFILKPFGFTTLKEVLERIAMQSTDSAVIKKNGVQKITFKTRSEMHFFNEDEIVYFQADSNYTNIYLKSGNKLTLARTLKKIEADIQEYSCFLRIHNSYIVNLSYVSSFDSYTYSIKLFNGNSVDVSENKKNELLKMLNSRTLE